MKNKSFQKRFMSKTQKMVNKKAELDNLIKIILWVIFSLIIGGALYFLINRLTG